MQEKATFTPPFHTTGRNPVILTYTDLCFDPQSKVATADCAFMCVSTKKRGRSDNEDGGVLGKRRLGSFLSEQDGKKKLNKIQTSQWKKKK